MPSCDLRMTFESLAKMLDPLKYLEKDSIRFRCACTHILRKVQALIAEVKG